MLRIREFIHSHKKALWISCACLFLAWGILTLAMNVFLSSFKDTASKIASDALTYRVSIGKMGYSFPDKVISRDISITPKTGPTVQVARFPFIKTRISIGRLLSERKVYITKIFIDSSSFRWQNFCQFIRENFEVILDAIKKIPKDDVKITLKENIIKLIDNNYGPDHLDVNLVFTINGDDVAVTGTLDAKGKPHSRKRKKNPPAKPLLEYEFKSQWTEEAFFIDSLVLNGENLYSKLWGRVEGRFLSLKGFSFLNTEEPRFKPDKQAAPLNIIERVKVFLRTLKGGKAPGRGLAPCNIYLTDLEFLAKADFPRIDIQRFDVRFNNAPVVLTGEIILSDPPTFDIKTVFYPAFLTGEGMGDLIQTDLALSGKLQNDAFYVDSALKLRFANNATSMGTLKTVDIAIEDSVFDFYDYPHLKMAMGKGSTVWMINGNEHKISLSGLTAASDFGPDRIKEIGVTASAYEGNLSGKLLIDMAYLPFRFNAEARLTDMNANKLEELLVHFSKVYGRLDSNLVFRSYPQFDLKGDIDIHDGHLKNYDFFKWMSDTFNLHSLLDVYFYNAKTRFIVEPGRAGIYDIDLKAENLKVSGAFYIKNNDLVSSTLSTSLSRGLLAESKDFKPILNFFEKDISFLDFDFQLSGIFDAMNFLWLPNWTKERIRARTPDFIERIIERQVDEEL